MARVIKKTKLRSIQKRAAKKAIKKYRVKKKTTFKKSVKKFKKGSIKAIKKKSVRIKKGIIKKGRKALKRKGGKKKIKLRTVGNRELERALKELLSSASFVKVGIIGKPENKAHKASDKHVDPKFIGPSPAKAITNLEIGVIHEFGTKHIPQRSFLRSTYEKEFRKLGKVFTAGLKRTLARSNEPEKAIHKTLDFVGNWFVGRVKKTFTQNDWKPLKDPTRGGKNKEGLAKPLIDTGQLRASIGYQIIDVQVKNRIANVGSVKGMIN